MNANLDKIDHSILTSLQKDATLSMDALAEKVHLSRNACWRRIRVMEEAGVIKARVALVDAEKVGLGLQVFVLMKAGAHDPKWLKQFHDAVRLMPQIVGAHRMSGDLDYVLRVRVGSVKDYDSFYQDLIRRVPISDVSASFVMDDIKDTTELPL
ncbi:Bacterial regulatory proteins, AsnC family:Helix-turn-helix, Fis-type [Rhodobacterales bacterium HTCC2150]|nr:Bacterial regulatory proteins, AsnC family:Helix-turn-helix, Fis-type [Rhodobacterales bacterium HTCC2150] [Rhodobacteraceae bacterium HTCC2150]